MVLSIAYLSILRFKGGAAYCFVPHPAGAVNGPAPPTKAACAACASPRQRALHAAACGFSRQQRVPYPRASAEMRIISPTIRKLISTDEPP